MYLRVRALISTTVLIATLFPLSVAFAQTPQNYPAACKELFQLPNGTFMQGVDTKLLGNEEVCNAYKFLLTRYEIGPRSAPCIKTKIQGVTGLNPDLAVRVTRLIQDMEQALGGRNIVRSAYRPQACGGGIGHSNGCAVDIEWAHSGGWRPASDNPNVAETQWVRANGANQKYRIHFPFPYPPEWHHIEPMDRASCIAGRAMNPNVDGVQATPPTTSLASRLREALGMQPQATPQAVAPSQPLSTTLSPLGSFSNPSPSSNTLEQPPALITASSSVADRLLQLIDAQPTPATTSATSVPIVIANAPVGGITPRTTPEVVAQPTNTQGSPIQQTFTTQDLQWQSQTPQSTYVRVLATLKTILQQLLQILTPFDARHISPEAEDDY